MSKKFVQQEEVVQQRSSMRAVYRIINPVGTVPVARPASNIQLTPIVQPVAFVPYSTQEQPILCDNNGEY